MNRRKKAWGRWFNLPARRLFGCDNSGTPIVPEASGLQGPRKNGIVKIEVGEMEPDIQQELDRILRDLPPVRD